MDAVPAMNTNRPIRLTAEGAVCVFQAPIVRLPPAERSYEVVGSDGGK